MEQGFELIRVDQLADASLGARVSFFRRKMGFTQKELATRIDVSQATISRLEKDPRNVPLRVLDAVKRELGITYADLTESASLQINPTEAGELRVGDVM